jgi:MFS family permease
VLHEYASRLGAFSANARLYLLYLIITGAAMGVFRLLFNFFAISLGFDEALLGNLVTISSMSALAAALPMGYLADALGRKRSLLIAGLLSSLAIVLAVLPAAFPALGLAAGVAGSAALLYGANILLGVSQSLAAVTNAPFLMENSGEEERTYLFSFASGLGMAAASLGNWVGGNLPAWVGGRFSAEATSTTAYGGALLIIAAAGAAGLLPLLVLRSRPGRKTERTIFAPVRYAMQKPGLLGLLILPMLMTSIGAGLIMPFMNIFYRQVYDQPDPVIGALFAWGSLAMGVGLMIAPPLADRMGKIQLVVITQALSIPFLILMGFAPWFWLSASAYYIRLALMNMSGPVYQTFVMEHVESSARATVASLVSMAWNFGWAFSPTISGWLQVRYGFAPAFIGTIILYIISILMYWGFFWRGAERFKQTAESASLVAPAPGD